MNAESTNETAKKRRRTHKEVLLDEQAKEIKKQAEEYDLSDNFFFKTTFERYETQLTILRQLQEEIDRGEMTVKKEYVKGRKNVVINPAITEYNKTTTAANQTAITLMKMIEAAKAAQNSNDDIDPLTAIFGDDD